jgi:hypothetical protein
VTHLAAISRRFQATRRDVAKAPPQIVSPSLSQSESPVAVDLRIHARNDGQPLARAPMVHAGRHAGRRDRAGVANTILGLVRNEACPAAQRDLGKPISGQHQGRRDSILRAKAEEAVEKPLRARRHT